MASLDRRELKSQTCRSASKPGAKACDRGETVRYDAAGAILAAAEKVTWIALEVLGSNGNINENPGPGRLLRDAKL